jgi:hypothetical protein
MKKAYFGSEHGMASNKLPQIPIGPEKDGQNVVGSVFNDAEQWKSAALRSMIVAAKRSKL